jgi:hypothetical protein
LVVVWRGIDGVGDAWHRRDRLWGLAGDPSLNTSVAC